MLPNLTPEQRKVFIGIIRQFARDSGAARQVGLECAEEAILAEIRAGRVKVSMTGKKEF